jgi:hypothetical protein
LQNSIPGIRKGAAIAFTVEKIGDQTKIDAL